MSDNWILTTITFLPLVGAVGLLFFYKEAKKAIAWFATAVMFVGMVVSFPLFTRYVPAGAPFQFEMSVPWIPAIGVSYHVGVEGISILLILLTTILGFHSRPTCFSNSYRRGDLEARITRFPISKN